MRPGCGTGFRPGGAIALDGIEDVVVQDGVRDVRDWLVADEDLVEEGIPGGAAGGRARGTKRTSRTNKDGEQGGIRRGGLAGRRSGRLETQNPRQRLPQRNTRARVKLA
jgi:hypothetical protein